MSVHVSHHFDAGLTVRHGVVIDPTMAALYVGETGREGQQNITLVFSRVADIETIVAALQKLGNDFAAAQAKEDADAEVLPVPVVQDSVPHAERTGAAHEGLSDFGCSPELIARAEADAEAADINRLAGRDPHECVKCGQYGCVCTTAVIPQAATVRRLA